MSYINDALRKVQKEKESRYVAYEHIVSAPGKELNRPKKWLSIIGIAIVFFWAAGIIAVLYWPENSQAPGATVAKPAVIRVVPAAPQIIEKTITEKINGKELKAETASTEIKAKQGFAEAKILFAQALERQREGKLDEAKKIYQKVVEVDQHNVLAFNNLGVIYMGEKNYKRAIMRFNDALNIKPDYVDAHYNLACLYAQKNDASRSLFYLKNAIRHNPKVRKWAANDSDLQVMADLPEFKKLLEKQQN
jgi:tetratricopeptide (TPR) repeat protein